MKEMIRRKLSANESFPDVPGYSVDDRINAVRYMHQVGYVRAIELEDFTNAQGDTFAIDIVEVTDAGKRLLKENQER